MKTFRNEIMPLIIIFIMVLAVEYYVIQKETSQEPNNNVEEIVEETLSFKDSVQYDPLLYLTKNIINDTIIKFIEEGNNRHVVTATVYNPVVGQCDSTPLITADRSTIDLEKLNSGDLKWIAVSRELREHYGYGSTVRLTCPDNPEINGIYEVHDTMNSRFTRYIDILVPENVKTGKWKNVLIEKV